MFWKEILKKLRNKLLIKVLEKQDELAIKTEYLTNLTSVRLSELRQGVKTSADIQTELWASLERASAKAASKQEAVELKTVINALQVDVEKTLSAVARVQTELQASLEKATASAVSKQEATELKAEIKTLKVDAEKTLSAVARVQTELQASLEKANAEQPSPISLKAEKGLQNYLRLLKSLSKRYMILIAVRDTTGAFLTDDIATGIKALGFTVDLSFEKGLKKQHHHSYVGVIDRGQVVCEAVSKQKETTYYMATREGVFYEVVSKSYPEGNTAVIKIDGVDYATNRRGLNIVVFDPITKTMIDSVCFDTSAPALYCSRFEDVISSIKRKLDALLLSGYTVPQYCIDNKITNVVIYSESEYWNIVENICISFWLNRKVSIRKFCATRPFTRQPLDNNMLFPVSNFISMNDVKLIMDDTVLIIHPNPQTDLIKRFEAYGARVITLTQIVADMHNYIFNGVRALLDYSVKRPDVKIICYRTPAFPTKDLSANEQDIKTKGIPQTKIGEALRRGELLTHSFDDLHYTNEELVELFTLSDRIYTPDGEFAFRDKAGSLVNYVDGRRVTTDQPAERKRSIFALGLCYAVGSFAPDDKTIWSYMQRRFNEDTAELGIAMENYTAYSYGNWQERYKKLSYIPAKSNDIVLIDIWAPEYFPSIDLRELFQRPHNYGEVFIDTGSHYNENGYRAIADVLFKSLQEHNFFEDKLPRPPGGQDLGLHTRRCLAYHKVA